MELRTLFEFNEEVVHEPTGLTGTVIAVDYWKNGCIRYAIQPRVVKDGKPVEATWCDEQDLKSRSRLPAKKSTTPKAKVGGPQADCPPPGQR